MLPCTWPPVAWTSRSCRARPRLGVVVGFGGLKYATFRFPQSSHRSGCRIEPPEKPLRGVFMRERSREMQPFRPQATFPIEPAERLAVRRKVPAPSTDIGDVTSFVRSDNCPTSVMDRSCEPAGLRCLRKAANPNLYPAHLTLHLGEDRGGSKSAVVARTVRPRAIALSQRAARNSPHRLDGGLIVASCVRNRQLSVAFRLPEHRECVESPVTRCIGKRSLRHESMSRLPRAGYAGHSSLGIPCVLRARAE